MLHEFAPMAPSGVTFRFWGVRGSLPTPGPETLSYGGDTACAEFVTPRTRVILDCGSGMRRLGARLMAEPDDRETFVLLTHPHFDHVCGLPFFVPIFVPGVKMRFGSSLFDMKDMISRLFSRPFFPVSIDMLGADLDYFRPPASGELALNDEVRLVTAPMNHPGGCTGYRLEACGVAVAWVTDTEHVEGETDENAVRLMAGADLAVYDAAYTVEEYPGHIGWGHSTPDEGVRLARLTGCRRLALFHHNPTRIDREMQRIEMRAAARMEGCFAARDGLELALPAAETAAA